MTRTNNTNGVARARKRAKKEREKKLKERLESLQEENREALDGRAEQELAANPGATGESMEQDSGAASGLFSSFGGVPPQGFVPVLAAVLGYKYHTTKAKEEGNWGDHGGLAQLQARSTLLRLGSCRVHRGRLYLSFSLFRVL